MPRQVFFMMRGLQADQKMTMILCWQPQKDEMSVKIVTFVISDIVNIIIPKTLIILCLCILFFSKANSKTWPTTEDSYKSNSVQEVLRLWWGLLCLFLWYENAWIQIWLISIFLKQKQNKNGNSNLKYEWASLSCFVCVNSHFVRVTPHFVCRGA